MNNVSQKELILNYMREEGSIDPFSALMQLGCFRLAARIHELREDGHAIESELVHTETSKHSVYWIEEVEE